MIAFVVGLLVGFLVIPLLLGTLGVGSPAQGAG